jgi:ankyrin repeat protein
VLRQAARGGRVDLVQLLLARGANPDAADASGHGPLYFAAASGSADVVALLLDKGVDVNRRDQYGFSALYAASGQGSRDVMQVLLSHGAKLGDGWSTAVAAAVYAHRLDIASLLMNKATPSERTAAGLVALYLAADAGDVAMMKLLLDYGVPTNYADTAGDMPLTRALGVRGRSAGHPDAAKLLVEAGAPLDVGRIPPLLLACEQGYADVVKAMIARGVNVDVTDDNGSSAITLAARSGSAQTFLALLPKAKTGLNPPELAYFIWPEK